MVEFRIFHVLFSKLGSKYLLFTSEFDLKSMPRACSSLACCNECYLRCVIFEGEGGDTEAFTGQLLAASAAVFTTQEVNLLLKYYYFNILLLLFTSPPASQLLCASRPGLTRLCEAAQAPEAGLKVRQESGVSPPPQVTSPL